MSASSVTRMEIDARPKRLLDGVNGDEDRQKKVARVAEPLLSDPSNGTVPMETDPPTTSSNSQRAVSSASSSSHQAVASPASLPPFRVTVQVRQGMEVVVGTTTTTCRAAATFSIPFCQIDEAAHADNPVTFRELIEEAWGRELPYTLGWLIQGGKKLILFDGAKLFECLTRSGMKRSENAKSPHFSEMQKEILQSIKSVRKVGFSALYPNDSIFRILPITTDALSALHQQSLGSTRFLSTYFAALAPPKPKASSKSSSAASSKPSALPKSSPVPDAKSWYQLGARYYQRAIRVEMGEKRDRALNMAKFWWEKGVHVKDHDNLYGMVNYYSYIAQDPRRPLEERSAFERIAFDLLHCLAQLGHPVSKSEFERVTRPVQSANVASSSAASSLVVKESTGPRTRSTQSANVASSSAVPSLVVEEPTAPKWKISFELPWTSLQVGSEGNQQYCTFFRYNLLLPPQALRERICAYENLTLEQSVKRAWDRGMPYVVGWFAPAQNLRKPKIVLFDGESLFTCLAQEGTLSDNVKKGSPCFNEEQRGALKKASEIQTVFFAAISPNQIQFQLLLKTAPKILNTKGSPARVFFVNYFRATSPSIPSSSASSSSSSTVPEFRIQSWYRLGNFYSQEKGLVKQNLETAAFWWQKSAAMNHTESLFALACYHSEKVSQDGGFSQEENLKAIGYLKQAADRGHLKAKHELAAWYVEIEKRKIPGESGLSVKEGERKGLQWASELWKILNKPEHYKSAGMGKLLRELLLPLAEKGYAEAQYLLGVAYADPRIPSVPFRKTQEGPIEQIKETSLRNGQAISYWQKAEKQGNSDAATRLGSLRRLRSSGKDDASTAGTASTTAGEASTLVGLQFVRPKEKSSSDKEMLED